MQPYIFPYIGYWQLIYAVDVFVIFDDVHYIKKGYINRNSILSNGYAHRFTLGLAKASQNKLINEIEVLFDAEKLLKTFYYSYVKAPFFLDVYPMIEKILYCAQKNLAHFLGFSLAQVSAYLDLNTNFIYSSNIEKDSRLKGQDKIINICKKIGASDYINPFGGVGLYSKSSFHEEGVSLFFLKSHNIIYSQGTIDFIPSLSIIDVLMFNSKNEVRKLLSQYSLVA